MPTHSYPNSCAAVLKHAGPSVQENILIAFKMFKSFVTIATRLFAALTCGACTSLFFLVSLAVLVALRARRQNGLRKVRTVAFFHPYCLGGGGGERVLWAAVKSLGKRFPDFTYVIYTGDDPRKCLNFRSHVVDRFNISVPEDVVVEFVHLSTRTLLEAHHYPVLTMIGQSLGSVAVGLEGLWKFCPDIFIDTTGAAFTIPLFRLLGGCRTAAYVHYPTISTDMLSRVRDRKVTYNNAGMVSRSPLLSWMKVVYYNLLAFLYGLAGGCCQLTLVNSTWTFNHIRALWKCPTAKIVYPPCNAKQFLALPLHPDETKPEISIVSIGQFRPEKDHRLQIEVLAGFLEQCPAHLRKKVKLHFVGSCRNAGDEERVEALRQTAQNLQVTNHVVYHLNAPFPELLKVCENGTIGIHAMWNEHFGIGVVECMAAGLITIAHDSGGPKADILIDWNGGKTGFLGHDRETYVKALIDILQLDDLQRSEIRKRARSSVSRFTDEEFDQKFGSLLTPLLRSCRPRSS